MSKVERPTEAELQAYVDDRLGFERRVEIEAYLLAHPAAASRIQSYRKSRHDLQEALRAKLREPIPRRLRVSGSSAGACCPRRCGCIRSFLSRVRFSSGMVRTQL